MKICPVCNDSFADELNFCDLDGTRLTREGPAQDRNKWWSLVGAGLLVGALVISAMSIILLPKARVSTPAFNSEPPAAPAPPTPSTVESAPSVAAATPEAEPGRPVNDTVAPELKKKEKPVVNGNSGDSIPNPKAAALAAEGGEKAPANADIKKTDPSVQKHSETPSEVSNPRDAKTTEAPSRPAGPSPDLRSGHQPQPGTRSNDKNPDDKKKTDEKEKKKGGFLKVFKKIFGKG